MSLTIQLLNTTDQFAALRPEWNALAERSVYPNIFTDWDWQFAWWKWFAPALEGELMILAIRSSDGSELLGIVPFYRRRRRLFFIGYGGRTCPEYLGPIVRDDSVQEIVDAAVGWLRDHPKAWDSIFIEDYALDDQGTSMLVDRLRAIFPVHGVDGETRLTVRLTGDYDAYLATLSYNSRRQRRKRFNQALARHDARIEYPTADTLDTTFPILVDLTTRARERHGERNPFIEPDYAGFHRELLATLLPKNRALLALLYLDDTPAAAWYCFLYGKKCYAYQQGFRPDFEGSPSDVCQQFLVQRLCEERYGEFDYLRGLESYKNSVANAGRPTRSAHVFRRRGFGFLFRIFLDRILRPVYRKMKKACPVPKSST